MSRGSVRSRGIVTSITATLYPDDQRYASAHVRIQFQFSPRFPARARTRDLTLARVIAIGLQHVAKDGEPMTLE